jgi:transcriptional regulator with XRE-family HTH domain
MSYPEFKKQIEQDPEYIKAMRSLHIKFDLGNAIVMARSRCGLSQSALARAIGTKQANISRIEAGLGNPTIDLIQRLANHLDLNIQISLKEPEDQTINLPKQGENIEDDLAYKVDLINEFAVAEKKTGYRKRKNTTSPPE